MIYQKKVIVQFVIQQTAVWGKMIKIKINVTKHPFCRHRSWKLVLGLNSVFIYRVTVTIYSIIFSNYPQIIKKK